MSYQVHNMIKVTFRRCFFRKRSRVLPGLLCVSGFNFKMQKDRVKPGKGSPWLAPFAAAVKGKPQQDRLVTPAALGGRAAQWDRSPAPVLSLPTTALWTSSRDSGVGMSFGHLCMENHRLNRDFVLILNFPNRRKARKASESFPYPKVDSRKL